jgi:exodeoxyribonuclease VII small subunit
MTYNEALEALKEIARKIENDDLGLDEIEGLLKKASELAAVCRASLRRVHDQLQEFQNPENQNPS